MRDAAAKFTDEDAARCRLIDEIHLEDPAFGARKIRDVLRRHHGIDTGRSRISRLMKLMGISAIYRRPRTSLPGMGEDTSNPFEEKPIETKVDAGIVNPCPPGKT